MANPFSFPGDMPQEHADGAFGPPSSPGRVCREFADLFGGSSPVRTTSQWNPFHDPTQSAAAIERATQAFGLPSTHLELRPPSPASPALYPSARNPVGFPQVPPRPAGLEGRLTDSSPWALARGEFADLFDRSSPVRPTLEWDALHEPIPSAADIERATHPFGPSRTHTKLLSSTASTPSYGSTWNPAGFQQVPPLPPSLGGALTGSLWAPPTHPFAGTEMPWALPRTVGPLPDMLPGLPPLTGNTFDFIPPTAATASGLHELTSATGGADPAAAHAVRGHTERPRAQAAHGTVGDDEAASESSSKPPRGRQYTAEEQRNRKAKEAAYGKMKRARDKANAAAIRAATAGLTEDNKNLRTLIKYAAQDVKSLWAQCRAKLAADPHLLDAPPRPSFANPMSRFQNPPQ